MNEFWTIALIVLILDVLIVLLVCDWISQKRYSDISVAPWMTQRLNFALFAWVIFVAVLIVQHVAAALVPANAVENSGPEIMLPSMAVHSVIILIMLFGPKWQPDVFPPQNRGMSGILAAPAGVFLFLAGMPLVWASTLAWNYLCSLWEKFDIVIDTPPQELVTILRETDSVQLLTVAFILAVFLAPISEELVFRGAIYRFLKGRIHPLAALTGTSLLFAFIHFNIHSFLALFTLGMLLGRSYERTGSIVTPILYHACFNLTTMLIVILLPPDIAIEPANGILFALTVLSNVLP